MLFGSGSLCACAGPRKGPEMFVEQIRRAIAATPRAELCRVASTIWKGHAAGALSDDEAQALAEAVEARKAVPATTIARRSSGSRPRSPESMERRRRWVASGLMPPQIAARFTMGEGAVLAVVAAEVSKRGACKMTIGHIAALAGVCATTVRNAIREAAALGLLRSEEWRLSAFRNAPNTVTILSAEWTSWLRLGAPRGRVQNGVAHAYVSTKPAWITPGRTKEAGGEGTAKSRPAFDRRARP